MFDLSLAELIPYLCLPLFHFPLSPAGSLVLCGFTTIHVVTLQCLLFSPVLPSQTVCTRFAEGVHTSHKDTDPKSVIFPLFSLA